MHVRALWVQERSSLWWDHIVGSTFTADDRLTNCMSRNTFLVLCNELKHDIIKNDTVMRKAIQRVAITLWTDFRTIVHLFGVSKASVSLIRKNVCKAIVKLLLPKYITFPTDTRLHGWKKESSHNAIDGTHLPIEQGTVDHEVY